MRAPPAHLGPDHARRRARRDSLGDKVRHTLEHRRPVRQNLLAATEATVRVQRLLAAIIGREEGRDGSRVMTVHRRDQLFDDVGRDSTPYSCSRTWTPDSPIRRTEPMV